MAETYYIDVVETDNVDCVLDGIIELVSADANIACVSKGAGILTFTVEADGAYRITSAGTTPFTGFAIGNKVIVRGSVDTTGLINNDGVYTVEAVEGASAYSWIEVVEPVVACASVAAAYVDEYATFILHPTKRTGQMLVFISSAAALAEFDVSFEPGGYWASKIEIGQPVYQGEVDTGDAAKMYLLQIETAPYMKTIEKKVAIDATATNDVQTKGTILMRVFPGVPGDPLLVGEIEVAYIMIA